MEWIKQIWEQLSSLFKWWVIVLPWEQGIRVRAGKHVKVLHQGIHFRIPYIDSCYRQSVRLNFLNFAPQTLTTKDGKTLTISLILGYSINDIHKVYNSVNELEGAVAGRVMSSLARLISENELLNCSPSDVEKNIKQSMNDLSWGVEVKEISVTSYALVRTYRLIQDSNWMDTRHKLDAKI